MPNSSGDRPDVGYDDAKNLGLAAFVQGGGGTDGCGVPRAVRCGSIPSSTARTLSSPALAAGIEGGGVADLLFGKADFRGKLPYSWREIERPDRGQRRRCELRSAFCLRLRPALRRTGVTSRAARGARERCGSRSRNLVRCRQAGKRTPSAPGAPGALSTNPGPELIDARAGRPHGAGGDSMRLRAGQGQGMPSRRSFRMRPSTCRARRMATSRSNSSSRSTRRRPPMSAS